MPALRTSLDFIEALLRGAADGFDQGEFVRPACVLWCDGPGEWENAVPLLSERLPVFRLGAYDPEERTGPAVWIRTVVDVWDAPESVPVIYLPGVRREDLTPAAAGDALRPLVELQFRGTLFERTGGRSWTVATFFGKGGKGSVGLEVTPDARRGLPPLLALLLGKPVAELAGRTITPQSLNLLAFPDLPAALLGWLSEGQEAAPENLRTAVHSEYGVDLTHGPLTVAARLAGREGPLAAVWDRYAQSPAAYPGVRSALLRAGPAGNGWTLPGAQVWPGVNAAAEEALLQGLRRLADLPAGEAVAAILALEQEHAGRRAFVWAALRESPLAAALGELAALVRLVQLPFPAGERDDMARTYAAQGYRVDRGVLRALGSVQSDTHLNVIGAALAPLYREWLSTVNEAFLHALQSGEKGGALPRPESSTWPAKKGVAVVFVDGLRFDLAADLATSLQDLSYDAALDWQYSAVPSVTPTAKPAVAPAGWPFEVLNPEALTLSYLGRKVTAEVLRDALRNNGFQPAPGVAAASTDGAAWLELGDFDRLGHGRGLRLALDVSGELRRLRDNIQALLDAGFTEVRVITDHGWLLVPGGLEKVDLPPSLTDLKKGRCAVLKPENASGYPTLPWSWDDSVPVTLARGVCSFEAGEVYAHGGVSLQELVIPVLTVTRPGQAGTSPVQFDECRWKNNRLRVEVTGGTGMTVDLRRTATDALSSVVTRPALVTDDGLASLLVEADDLDGQTVVLVALDGEGRIVRQREVKVGENS